METTEQIRIRMQTAVPGAQVAVEGRSLVVSREHLLAVVRFLKNDPALAMDYVANLCAVDWLPRKVKAKQGDAEVEQERPGYLEVVYDFYSMAKKQGPVQIKCRTDDREGAPELPSITPLFRGAELQEREAYDLYGIWFTGHPDLRRILMWDGFRDYPMRKDYRPPDDFEYEPTPHDDVLARAKQHWPATPAGEPAKPS